MGIAVKALREIGITDVIKRVSHSFSDLGDISLSEIYADSEPSNLRNFPQFLKDTDTVNRGVRNLVSSDDFVFCLGGECTFIAGTLAGFKDKFAGKPGILWMDAHGDFNTPETTPSGFIGGMCLALACGRGPKLSWEIEGSRPLISEENVVHLGSRALDPLEAKAMEASPLKLIPASKVHQEGVSKVANEAAEHLSDSADWLICHFDVDVTGTWIIPAVNFPEKGPGLTLEQVRTVVEALRKTGKLKVFDLTAYNPTLDQNHTSGKKILNLISEIFF